MESNIPLELAQEILDHASVTTTRIYVRAREKRIAAAAGEYFGALGKPEARLQSNVLPPEPELIAAFENGQVCE